MIPVSDGRDPGNTGHITIPFPFYLQTLLLQTKSAIANQLLWLYIEILIANSSKSSKWPFSLCHL
jgi:hypothetical protein